MKNSDFFSTIMKLILLVGHPNLGRLIALQFLMIVASLLEITALFLVLPLVQLVLNPNDVTDFFILMPISFEQTLSVEKIIFLAGTFIILVNFLSLMVSIFKDWQITLFANKVGFGIGDDLFRKYLQSGLEFHFLNSSSYLSKQISIEAIRVKNMLKSLFHLNSNFFTISTIFFGLIFFKPIVTFVILIILVSFYLLVYGYLKPKLAANGRLLSELLKERFMIMSNGFGSKSDIILTGSSEYFAQKMDKTGALLARVTTKNQIFGLVPGKIVQSSLIMIVVSILVVMSNVDRPQTDLFLPLTVFLVSGLKIMPIGQAIYAAVANIQGNKSALDIIYSDGITATDSLVKNVTKSNSNKLTGQISLHNVTYFYPNTEKPIISNLSMVIAPLSKVGIIGETGSGKTTLLHLCASLLNPLEGFITVNGIKLTKERESEWRKSIALVSQDFTLIDGSVLENIAFGETLEQIDLDRAIECAKRAQILEHINSLPHQMYQNVGERGIQFSGGQRQRIALARALYRKAQFLLLDESTSALDEETENKVMEEILVSEHNCTLIIIAHRLKTLKHCDRILQMQNGAVVKETTYEEICTDRNPQFQSDFGSKESVSNIQKKKRF